MARFFALTCDKNHNPAAPIKRICPIHLQISPTCVTKMQEKRKTMSGSAVSARPSCTPQNALPHFQCFSMHYNKQWPVADYFINLL